MKRLAELLRAIGLKDKSGPPPAPKDEELRIYLAMGPDRIYVGRLRRNGDSFEFAYSPEFIERRDLPAIPDLPEKQRTYRSPVLWPFFLARLPPTDRPDIRQELEAAGISPADTLEVLGKLGRRAISSPYDLELVTAA